MEKNISFEEMVLSTKRAEPCYIIQNFINIHFMREKGMNLSQVGRAVKLDYGNIHRIREGKLGKYALSGFTISKLLSASSLSLEAKDAFLHLIADRENPYANKN